MFVRLPIPSIGLCNESRASPRLLLRFAAGGAEFSSGQGCAAFGAGQRLSACRTEFAVGGHGRAAARTDPPGRTGILPACRTEFGTRGHIGAAEGAGGARRSDGGGGRRVCVHRTSEHLTHLSAGSQADADSSHAAALVLSEIPDGLGGLIAGVVAHIAEHPHGGAFVNGLFDLLGQGDVFDDQALQGEAEGREGGFQLLFRGGGELVIAVDDVDGRDSRFPNGVGQAGHQDTAQVSR